MKIKEVLLPIVLAVGTVASASATPLRMDYQITDLGGSVLQYDFTLTLDNHDSSWALGQQWDWIIFGDNSDTDSYNGFDPDGIGSPNSHWTTTNLSSSISAIGTTYGSHNGPNLNIDTNSVLLPGWSPTALGDFISWSGTSDILIPDGELYWSSLIVGGGAQYVYYELAHQIQPTANVPEPSSLALFAAGIAVLGFGRRRCLSRK